MKLLIVVLLCLIAPGLAQDDNGTIVFFDGPGDDIQFDTNKEIYPVFPDVRIMGDAMGEENSIAAKILSFFGNNTTNGFKFTPPPNLTIA